MVGLPWSTIALLPRVQNAAARLVMGLSACDHIGPAPQELHRLPVVHCIKFKVALLMYVAENRLCPLYISEVLSLTLDSSTSVHWQLRSSGSSSCTVLRTRNKFSNGTFLVAGPAIRNTIPEPIRAADNIPCFKCDMSTQDTHF